jgi:hypothetical protein
MVIRIVSLDDYPFCSWPLNSSYLQEGIGALWTGLGPNVARNAIINAAELASYDQFKLVIVHPFLACSGYCLYYH